MSKISIIIPVYNAKEYLSRCLTSVCGQTYQELEIICVDDGSTDGSGEVVDRFAETDPRIRVIHQKNGGESHARNIGLQASSGEYIGFMDCDDWIEPDMYATLLGNMLEKEVDLVACGFFIDTDVDSRAEENQLPVAGTVFGRTELFGYVYKRDYYKAFTGYIWCKLYKRHLLLRDGEWLQFDEDMRLGGDNLFSLKALSRVTRACYVPCSFYHYYQRDTSAMHTRVDLTAWLGILKGYERGILYLQENRIEEDIIPWLQRFRGYWAYRIAGYAYEQKNALIFRMCQAVMQEHKEMYMVLNNEYPGRIRDYQAVLSQTIIEDNELVN
ncbi:MAG: glycosyltransferase [Lachnospiraceae bacterium]|jgi:glycosyltransferase involved in cell wall biosynthesis|nr:glycosyltransferase [Lachnospiraceae bacterium]